MISQFASFLAVGAVATLSHYVVLIAGVEGLAMSPVSASGLGAFVGAIVSYGLNRTLTFHSDRAHIEALPRFMTVALLALVANMSLMALLTGPAGLPYLLAQVIVTALLITITFGLNKIWTFKR
ncbi:MAG: GtrA family protein [Pseudomonadota bacterium]